MTREEFLSRFGTVFENRPDLAAEAWERAAPVILGAGAEGLHRAFVAVRRNLPPDALLAFLNDHPDLAARSARPADLTPDLQREQGSAGLDGLDAAAGARLLDMNKPYPERFGFPFIMAAKGRQPPEIMAARSPPAQQRDRGTGRGRAPGRANPAPPPEGPAGRSRNLRNPPGQPRRSLNGAGRPPRILCACRALGVMSRGPAPSACAPRQRKANSRRPAVVSIVRGSRPWASTNCPAWVNPRQRRRQTRGPGCWRPWALPSTPPMPRAGSPPTTRPPPPSGSGGRPLAMRAGAGPAALHSDGRPLAHEACPMAVAIAEGRPVRGAHAVAERPDGTRVPFIPYPTPMRDATGRLIGAVNVLVDSPIAGRPKRPWPAARRDCAPSSIPRRNASSSSRRTAPCCR